jgi:hypothetical protein
MNKEIDLEQSIKNHKKLILIERLENNTLGFGKAHTKKFIKYFHENIDDDLDTIIATFKEYYNLQ